MRILALDYGTARIGCALTDPSGTLVRPLEAIEPVLVGLPLTPGGEEGAQAILTREFAAELERRLEVPVETYDERLTTKMAAASRREGAGAAEDSLAAAHLLEGYLASARGGKAADGA
jgi:putative holliday junction resolvase